MFIYICVIALVLFASLLYMQFPVIISTNDGQSQSIQETRRKSYLHPMFILVFVVLAFPYVARYGVGTDYYGYFLFYEWYSEYTFKQIMDMTDFGYYLLSWVDYKIFNGNWYWHCIVLAVLTYMPVLYYYFRFSNNLAYVMMVYILFMLYFSPYNAVRQCLASSMLLIAVISIIEKKYLKCLTFFIIAYTFHSTVLIIIPLLIFSFFSYRNRIIRVVKITMFASVIFLQGLWSKILDLLGGLGQDKLVSDYSNADISGKDGVSLLRVLVYLVPVIIVLFWGRYIYETFFSENYDEASTKHINFVFNAVEFAAIFMVAGLKYWVFSRLSLFFALFVPILLGYTYPALPKKYQALFRISSLILFFIYMWLLVHNESNLLPYITEFGWYFN